MNKAPAGEQKIEKTEQSLGRPTYNIDEDPGETKPDKAVVDELKATLNDILLDELKEDKSHGHKDDNDTKVTVTVPRWPKSDEPSVEMTWPVGRDEFNQPARRDTWLNSKTRVMSVINVKNPDGDATKANQVYILINSSPFVTASVDDFNLLRLFPSGERQQTTEKEIEALNDLILSLQFPDEEDKPVAA